LPNINLPIINIGTVYTGAGVLDIEKTVTYPIEKAVSAVSDVKFVESKSRQGLSTVRLWMNWGADVNNGQTEVIQRIQQILSSLPTGIRQPFVLRFDLSNIPVCLVTASGGGLDEKQLYDLAYNTIEPQLERLGGVASASVDGGKVRQITLNLSREHRHGGRPGPGTHPEGHRRAAAREGRNHVRPVDLHPPAHREPLARGHAGLGAGLHRHPDLPTLAHLDPHHLGRHPALDSALV